MKIQVEQLKRGQTELIVELSTDEYEPFLKRAAQAISEEKGIAGFRPGKAPYDIVKRYIGEEYIWEYAFESAVRKTLVQALEQKDIITVGPPKIDVIKLSPGNPVVYKAIVNVFPRVLNLKIDGVTVYRKSPQVHEKDVQKSLSQLQNMRATERLVDRPAEKGDRVECDFNIFIDRVPIEGGQNRNITVVLGEGFFLPGFEEQLIGMRAGETKEFQLTFPKEYYQKNIAGRVADVHVRVHHIYERILPELNDDFAKGLQFQNMEILKKNIEKNLFAEAKQREERRLENDLVDKLIERNTFTDIPDILIQEEARSLLQEIEQNVKDQGIDFHDYLRSLKTTRDQLLLDLTPSAVKRVKGAILFREIAQQENISVSDEEVSRALESLRQQFSHNSDMQKKFQQREYQEYMKNILRSQKVMDFLKEKIVKNQDSATS